MSDAVERTTAIPKEEWQSFFQGFARMHSGWLCTMEVFGPSIGAQIETRGMRLAGASAEVGHGEARIYLTMENGGGRLTHVVSAPKDVWLKQAADGADEAVEIDAGELKTLIRFRSAALTEAVDGHLER